MLPRAVWVAGRDGTGAVMVLTGCFVCTISPPANIMFKVKKETKHTFNTLQEHTIPSSVRAQGADEHMVNVHYYYCCCC